VWALDQQLTVCDRNRPCRAHDGVAGQPRGPVDIEVGVLARVLAAQPHQHIVSSYVLGRVSDDRSRSGAIALRSRNGAAALRLRKTVCATRDDGANTNSSARA